MNSKAGECRTTSRLTFDEVFPAQCACAPFQHCNTGQQLKTSLSDGQIAWNDY